MTAESTGLRAELTAADPIEERPHLFRQRALRVGPDVRLPRAELEYRVSRGGGPGEQHVNTSSTGVEVWWDITASPSLSDLQRARLLAAPADD